MIKVKETFQHNGHLVCKGRLIILEDNEATIGIIAPKGTKFEGQFVKPIIISETEEIEVGDKFLWKNELFDCSMECISSVKCGEADFYIKECKKVLALPEHFSPEILQMIVGGKLKNLDEVLLEFNEETLIYKSLHRHRQPMNNTNSAFFIKLDPQNHINLIPINGDIVKLSGNPNHLNFKYPYFETESGQRISHQEETWDSIRERYYNDFASTTSLPFVEWLNENYHPPKKIKQ